MSHAKNIPYGARLVPVSIDEIARDDPERVCFSIPKSSNLSDGFDNITFRRYTNAIDRAAWFIEQNIGLSSSFETVMYMGHADIRHYVILVAAMKTGYKVLFSSHRNSIAGHTDLLRKTNCKILLHSSSFPISNLLSAHPMRTFVMPELDILFSSDFTHPYPFTKTWSEASNNPTIIVHTSGSTGLPKPVIWTHATFGTCDAHFTLPRSEDNRDRIWSDLFPKSQRTYSTLPLFHGAALGSGVVQTTFLGKTIVFGPPEPVTPEVFGQVLEYGNVDGVSCIPSILDQISKVPEIVDKLSGLKYISYVGGQLPRTAGEIISKKTHLLSIIGSTETSSLVQYVTDPPDWNYFCIPTQANGIEFRPRIINTPQNKSPNSNNSTLYELVFIKNPAVVPFQNIFKICPDLQEYSMSDLYSPHPSKPNHWKHEGRVDDMIVLANGWNVNPILHEQLIASHPKVKNCILTGTGRSKLAVLIQLQSNVDVSDVEKRKGVVEEIWGLVDRANEMADSTAQLERAFCVFASPEKPFFISGKGSVQRKATVELYSGELDNLYERELGA